MRGLKLSSLGSGETASTLERIGLDETAVGTMGIEWTTRVWLGGAEEECQVAGEW